MPGTGLDLGLTVVRKQRGSCPGGADLPVGKANQPFYEKQIIRDRGYNWELRASPSSAKQM